MLVATSNTGTHNEYMCVSNCRQCTFIWTFCKKKQWIIYTTHVIRTAVISYSIFVQSTSFPHRLRMSVSYSKPGAYVLTLNRFRIPLQRRRPPEPSSRPPCRSSPGAVKAGGIAGEETNEKVCLESRKGLRSAESARISTPSTTRFWICYIYYSWYTTPSADN